MKNLKKFIVPFCVVLVAAILFVVAIMIANKNDATTEEVQEVVETAEVTEEEEPFDAEAIAHDLDYKTVYLSPEQRKEVMDIRERDGLISNEVPERTESVEPVVTEDDEVHYVPEYYDENAYNIVEIDDTLSMYQYVSVAVDERTLDKVIKFLHDNNISGLISFSEDLGDSEETWDAAVDYDTAFVVYNFDVTRYWVIVLDAGIPRFFN